MTGSPSRTRMEHRSSPAGRLRPAGRLCPAIVLLGALALAACGAEPEEPDHDAAAIQDRDRGRLPGVLSGVTPPPGVDVVRPDPAGPGGLPAPEPPGLRTLPTAEVQGWMGPGGHPFHVTLRTPGDPAHLHATIGRSLFPLPARPGAPVLVQYPCTSCHEGVVLMADRIADAHRNIQPLHPSTTGATCSTCHVPESVELLGVPGEGTVGLDHAYRLCAQCHSSEVRDWAGGVHGKRLEGWSGRRVVMNCADCHDPHAPALEPRAPYPGPSLRTGDRR